MMKKPAAIPVFIYMVLMVLVITACSFQVEKTPPIKRYIIDPKPVTKLSGKPGGEQIPVTLVFLPIEGTFSFRTRKIYYKRSKISQNSYLYSRWEDAPTRMLTAKLLKSLDAAGIFKAVTLLYTRSQADLSLGAFLFDFTQHITPNGNSFGVISITFQLIEKYSGKIIATKSFEIKKSTPTTDAEGAAKALNDASDELCTRLITWLRNTVKTLPTKP